MPDEKILGGESSEGVKGEIVENKPSAGEVPETVPEQAGEVQIEGGQERLEGKYHEILSQVVPQAMTGSQDDDTVPLDAKSIGDTVDEDSKIQKLLDLASAKGVAYAVKVARSLQDYYALDRMHDELVDKLYDGLLAKGLIKKD